MKKIILLTAAIFAFCILHTACCFSQGTAINTTGNSADNSAILDVNSKITSPPYQGLLIPRLTTVKRDSIISPAEALMIFNTTTKCFEAFVNNTWNIISCPGTCISPSAAGVIGGTGSVCQGGSGIGYSVGSISGATNYVWTYSGSGATINGSSNNITLDFSVSATPGNLTVYGTNSCGNGATSPPFPISVNLLPAIPVATSATNILQSSFSANWNAASGATAYYLDVSTVSNFSTFVTGYNNRNVGSGVTYSVTGISCGVTYFYRVRANNSCGSSPNSNDISVSTSACFAGCLAIGGSGYDMANSLIQSSDGGFALAGYTESYGSGGDIYIAKLDAASTLSWTKTLGCASQDAGFSVVQSSDGGFAVAGYMPDHGPGCQDFYLAKVDAGGGILWNKVIGGASNESPKSMIYTKDGGYALAGTTTSFGAVNQDFYVVKTDGNGIEEWSRAFGGNGWEECYSIFQSSDSGYVVAGSTTSYGSGNEDIYVVKLDKNGNYSWSKTFGGPGYDVGYAVTQASDGGYAVTGYTTYYGAGGYDVYIVKMDASGSLLWSKTVGGSGSEMGKAIIPTSDGGLAVAGSTDSFDDLDADAFIVKVNGSGVLQWAKTYGGSNVESANGIIQTSNGGYAIAGYTYTYGVNTDMYFATLDANGNSCCSVTQSPSESSGGAEKNGGSVNAVSSSTDSYGNYSYGGSKTDICN